MMAQHPLNIHEIAKVVICNVKSHGWDEELKNLRLVSRTFNCEVILASNFTWTLVDQSDVLHVLKLLNDDSLQSTRVKHLNLATQNLMKIPSTMMIFKITNLESLTLDFDTIDSDMLVSLVNLLPKLRRLDMSSTKFININQIVMNILIENSIEDNVFPNLKVLELNSAMILQHRNVVILKQHLRKLKSLSYLVIHVEPNDDTEDIIKTLTEWQQANQMNFSITIQNSTSKTKCQLNDHLVQIECACSFTSFGQFFRMYQDPYLKNFDENFQACFLSAGDDQYEVKAIIKRFYSKCPDWLNNITLRNQTFFQSTQLNRKEKINLTLLLQFKSNDRNMYKGISSIFQPPSQLSFTAPQQFLDLWEATEYENEDNIDASASRRFITVDNCQELAELLWNSLSTYEMVLSTEELQILA